MSYIQIKKKRGLSMNKNEICEKIKEMLSKVMEDNGKVPTTFDEDIAELMDSIEFVMLIVEIENEFEIKIDDDDFEIENVDTISKFADLVMKYTVE